MRFSPRPLVALAAAGVLLILFFFFVVPPAPPRLESSAWDDIARHTVAGAYHVHSSRSDGAADKATIASAAARAGLRFLILTDHGDATRPPDPPAYMDGVLCLDAVEISTDDGHYVALDMPRSPYPLGGAAVAVVEDVARLGGFGIAAHPDSPRESLRWTDADARIDGIEWLNGDSEWRNESRIRLWRTAAGYLFRPGPALTMLLDRPATLDRWDHLTASRRVVGLAGLDAHGGIGRRAEDGNRSNIPGIPSYLASFNSFSLKVELERPWSGDAGADAKALFAAIRGGRVYSVIDGIARNGLLDFHAETATGQRIPMGGELPPGTTATLVARALMPASAEIVLLHAGRAIASAAGDVRQPVSSGDGPYRVEVRMPGAPGVPPVPWIAGNPIYFSRADASTPVATPAGEPSAVAAADWRIEKDPGSSAILRTGTGRVELQYTLRQGDRNSQYVAVAAPVTRMPPAVELTLSADRASRVSVQLRDRSGNRWGRSVYVSDTAREVQIPLDAFRPIGSAAPRPTDVASLLLVIDLTNAGPGRSGTVRIERAAVRR